MLGKGIHRTDPEGRILHVRIKEIQFVCVYLPSGSSSEARQHSKETKWMKRFLPWARNLTAIDEPVLMGGDFNIAHTEKDIFYAKGNEKKQRIPSTGAQVDDKTSFVWLARHLARTSRRFPRSLLLVV